MRLTVLYDGGCPLCVRCRAWLEAEPAFVALELLDARSRQARAWYSSVPALGRELVVVSDTGDVWIGPAAFLMCLWALVEWREWSYRLASPAVLPLADRSFQAVSRHRGWLGTLVGAPCKGGACGAPA